MSRPAPAAGAAGRLLADIGGTHARFAWQDAPGEPLSDLRTLPCAAHPRLIDAVRAYLAQVQRPQPGSAAIAIANPVLGDWVAMTNHHWAFSIQALQQELGLACLRVLNDFTALALALPLLPPETCWPVGGGTAVPGAALGLIGPGTGLGVSGLLPDGRGGWVPLAGEGGHVSLAPADEREARVLNLLTQWHGHASAERALSGPGLVDLHAALQHLDGCPGPRLSPAQVTAAGLAGQDAHCTEALQRFCGLLGSVAGNLALTLGARGGVYLGGGIVPRLGRWFAQSPFRARFEAKGRFADYLRGIPVRVIDTAHSPALQGAALALDAGPSPAPGGEPSTI